jgi:uncharacterized protein involved in outer membrane biogenesis
VRDPLSLQALPWQRGSFVRAGWVILGLAGAAVVLGIVTAVLLITIDLRPLVERYATEAFGRPVTIGSLRIGWSSPLSVELSDLRLANAIAGGDPDMLRIARLSAKIDPGSLSRGVLRFEQLILERPSLLLERDTGGGVNWRFKGSGSSSSFHLALIPKNRTEFPTLIDFALRDGELIYRAAGRRDLRVIFHRLAIGAAGDNQAVTLDGDGAYDGTPVRLNGVTGSFSALRDKAVPFDVAVVLATKSDTLDFKGTVVEPLDLDGVAGGLKIAVPKLGELLKIFGADTHADVPLSIAGTLTTRGVHWLLTEATGKLAQDEFAGTLDLAESAAGRPDEIALTLDFARLDLKHLVAGDVRAGTAPASSSDIFLHRLDDNPGANVDARIAAKQLSYGEMRLADFATSTRVTAGEILVRALSFAFASGRVELSGRFQTTAAGNHIGVEAALSTADAARVAELAGLEAGQIAGQVEGRLRLEMTGRTMANALKTNQGQGVVSMTQGRVARDLVEKAATDLRSLVRKGEGWVPVACLLGVVDLRNGIATIAPLRLRTSETTVVGGGRADLSAEQVDLTIKAEGGSPSVFALQVPLRISGRFDKPTIAPTIGSSAAWLDAPARTDTAHPLAPALEQLAERNPCRH